MNYENGVLKYTHFYDHYLVRVDKYIYDVVYLINEPDMDYVFDMVCKLLVFSISWISTQY